MDYVGVGELAEIERLQRELNAAMQAMTPAERAAVAVESLRHMPGQAYLFEGEAA